MLEHAPRACVHVCTQLTQHRLGKQKLGAARAASPEQVQEAGRGELQRLLDADTACCSRYKTNLNDDATALHFAPEELRGLPQSFIDERAVAVIVTLLALE